MISMIWWSKNDGRRGARAPHPQRVKNQPVTCNDHYVKSSQPVGEDKYAFVQRLKEFLYSLFHALPINSNHKPLISNRIELLSKVLILSLFLSNSLFICKGNTKITKRQETYNDNLKNLNRPKVLFSNHKTHASFDEKSSGVWLQVSWRLTSSKLASYLELNDVVLFLEDCDRKSKPKYGQKMKFLAFNVN